MGFGCAGLSGLWESAPTMEEGCALIKAAFDNGITFFDTSDVYGKDHHNELMVAKAIKELPREKIQIATKFGLKLTPEFQFVVNGRPEYVRACCEASLKRLGVNYIDLYYQHRIDTSVPIEDTMGELKKLVEEGKIKYVGLSEASPDTIRRAHAVYPLTAVQMEYSLWTRDIEEEVIPLCRELRIGVVPYSPLGIGFFAGKTNEGHAKHPKFMGENIERNRKLYARHAKLAEKHACTPPQLALSWLLHQKDGIVPIPGTTKLRNLENNLGSLTVKLTEEDLNEISKELPIQQVSGPRDRPMMAKFAWMNANTPPKILIN